VYTGATNPQTQDEASANEGGLPCFACSFDGNDPLAPGKKLVYDERLSSLLNPNAQVQTLRWLMPSCEDLSTLLLGIQSYPIKNTHKITNNSAQNVPEPERGALLNYDGIGSVESLFSADVFPASDSSTVSLCE
jgi:hypothetical protein